MDAEVEEVQPTQVIPPVSPERKKQVADRDRSLREHAGEFTELYVLALKQEDWKVLGFGSAGEWSDSILGSVKLDKLSRLRVAKQLAAEGETVREIAAVTGVSPATTVTDLKTAGGAPPATGSPKQKAARDREASRRSAQSTSGQNLATSSDAHQTPVAPEQQEPLATESSPLGAAPGIPASIPTDVPPVTPVPTTSTVNGQGTATVAVCSECAVNIVRVAELEAELEKLSAFPAGECAYKDSSMGEDCGLQAPPTPAIVRKDGKDAGEWVLCQYHVHVARNQGLTIIRP